MVSTAPSASITYLLVAPAPASVVWSGREDLNLRLPRPERGALPGCATPRSPDFVLKPAADTAGHVLPRQLDM